MSLDNSKQKYRNDPHYHAIVDQMVKWQNNIITPYELREAAFLACIKFEMEQVHGVLNVPNDVKMAMQRIDDFIFETENEKAAQSKSSPVQRTTSKAQSAWA